MGRGSENTTGLPGTQSLRGSAGWSGLLGEQPPTTAADIMAPPVDTVAIGRKFTRTGRRRFRTGVAAGLTVPLVGLAAACGGGGVINVTTIDCQGNQPIASLEGQKYPAGQIDLLGGVFFADLGAGTSVFTAANDEVFTIGDKNNTESSGGRQTAIPKPPGDSALVSSVPGTLTIDNPAFVGCAVTLSEAAAAASANDKNVQEVSLIGRRGGIQTINVKY
jgi:hypothetical protein